MENLNTKLSGYLSFLDNQFVVAILAIVLILYSGLIAPKLPVYVMKIFDNQFVKLLCIFLIAWLATRNPMLCIIAALAFVLTIMAINSNYLGISGLGEDLIEGIESRGEALYNNVSGVAKDLLYGDSQRSQKRVHFDKDAQREDKDAPYDLIGANAQQQDSMPAMGLGGYDETGFAERHLQ